jgi:DNA-directed RNA polymerase specialized sigma24 family protein
VVIYGPHGPDTADQAAVELEQVIRQLPQPQRQRQVLWLRLVADFSEAGAAEILGRSTGSVKTHRAIRSFRSALRTSGWMKNSPAARQGSRARWLRCWS